MANNTANLQRKFFDYAKNYAMEKLNKKLDEKFTSKSSSSQQQSTPSQQQQQPPLPPPPTTTSAASSSGKPTKYSKVEYHGVSCEYIANNVNSGGGGDDSGQSNSYDSHNNYNRSVNSGTKCEITNECANKLKTFKYKSISQNDVKKSYDKEDEYHTADEEDCLEIQMDDDRDSVLPSNNLNSNQKNDIRSDNEGSRLLGWRETPALPSPVPVPPPSSSSSSPASTVDISGYIQKKSLAQGMMDLALVSANTNQLRYILEYQEQHPYFLTSLALVISSLFLQLAVGLGLIWNSRLNVKKRKEMKEADRFNNFSVIGIFMITLINVFLSTFGGAPQSVTTAASPLPVKSDFTTISNNISLAMPTSTESAPAAAVGASEFSSNILETLFN